MTEKGDLILLSIRDFLGVVREEKEGIRRRGSLSASYDAWRIREELKDEKRAGKNHDESTKKKNLSSEKCPGRGENRTEREEV